MTNQVQLPEERREALITRLTESGGRLRVRNALNPILWLCALITMPCFAVLIWNPDPPLAVSILLLSVVGTALLAFIFLLIFDRDRLQSEEYLIKSRTLDLIEEKGSKRAIDAATVHAISQNEFLALPETKEAD